ALASGASGQPAHDDVGAVAWGQDPTATGSERPIGAPDPPYGCPLCFLRCQRCTRCNSDGNGGTGNPWGCVQRTFLPTSHACCGTCGGRAEIFAGGSKANCGYRATTNEQAVFSPGG